MPDVMVVGASRGIGLELARQYAQAGWRVHATTRTPRDPGALGAVAGDVHLYRLDVREAAEIEALAKALDDDPLDVLIHNAGVSGRGQRRDEVFAVNAQAPFAVVEALFPHLLRAPHPKLLLMTSQLGARRGTSGSLGVYGDSKAALNDRFRRLEPTWREQGVAAIVMHPGWVRTDMGGRGAPLEVEESVRGIRRVLDGLALADGGRFLTWDGRDHPW